MILLFLVCLFSVGSVKAPIIYDNVESCNENFIVERDNYRKESFSFNAYDYYGTAELGTPAAISNYIYYMSLLGVDCYTVASLYVHNFTLNGNAFFRSTFDVTGDTGAGRIFTCQNIQFRIDPVTRTDVNNSYQWYCLDFIDTTNSDHYYRYNFCRVENKKLGGTNIWISEGMYQGYYSVPSHMELLHLQNMVFCISNQNVDGIQGWSRLFFPYYMDEQDNGYTYGYNLGSQTGYSLGYNDGYNLGYDLGYDTAMGDSNPTMNSIFAGIFQVGLLPVNVFLTMFNYEIFGINVSGFVSGLLTISVIIIILRFLFGGGKDDK